MVLELAGLPLVLPKWARNDIPAQVWTAGEFELFAVKYREELETFLHLCYTYRHAMGAQLPPSNPQVTSRRDRQRQAERYRETSIRTIEEETEPIQETAPVAPPQPNPPPQHSEVVQETPVPFNLAPAPSRGYLNNPAQLSGSQRLSELVGESFENQPMSTPIRMPGPNIARQVPRQHQYRSHDTGVIQQPRPHHPSSTLPPDFVDDEQNVAFQSLHTRLQAAAQMTGEAEIHTNPDSPLVPLPPHNTPQHSQYSNRHAENAPSRDKPPGGAPSPSDGGGGPPSGHGPFGNNPRSGRGHQSGGLPYQHQASTGAGGGPPGGDPPGFTSAYQDRIPSPKVPTHFNRAYSDRTDYSAVRSIGEFHFDRKLKQDIIPTWDGDGDTLGDWLTTISALASRGKTMYTELGQIVPMRLKGHASIWFWSLNLHIQKEAMHSWGTLKHKICEFYMNRSWMDKQKVRANRASYCKSGYSQETPVLYVI